MKPADDAAERNGLGSREHSRQQQQQQDLSPSAPTTNTAAALLPLLTNNAGEGGGGEEDEVDSKELHLMEKRLKELAVKEKEEGGISILERRSDSDPDESDEEETDISEELAQEEDQGRGLLQQAFEAFVKHAKTKTHQITGRELQAVLEEAGLEMPKVSHQTTVTLVLYILNNF